MLGSSKKRRSTITERFRSFPIKKLILEDGTYATEANAVKTKTQKEKEKYSIICICQIYNELDKGNLDRFVKCIMPHVDGLAVFDDGSTDGSYEYMLKHTPHVIRGEKTDLADEMRKKQVLLDYALQLKPDFILWLDADEVFTANANSKLQELCAYCVENQIDGISFHELNLWRSKSWRRTDNMYDDGWFVRLWRVTPDISYGETKRGLHQKPYPTTIQRIECAEDVQVIHYGFSSERLLAYKYLVYKAYGQTGSLLDRLIDEKSLTLKKVPKELFPEGLREDDAKPQSYTLETALAYVDKYRDEVFRPKFSIVCLIYKNVEWAKFVYEQVLKYTDMVDKEFFFVANDASNQVLEYLRSNYIPHYIWNNIPEHKNEWYINNVYRAWNFAAKQAKGDFIVFINSDMAFAPHWFENLWKAYNGSNCVASRLVESGKLRSGKHGIEKDFGRDYQSYHEPEFLQYAAAIMVDKVEDGGLYMPLLVRKEHFESVNGYPEGNVVPNSDFFMPTIAQKGETCISGDYVLMEKLRRRGIVHQTSFSSIVYHFQCGEMDSAETKVYAMQPKIAVCNDLVTGTMGEKVLWDFLLESLPASVGIDTRLVKDGKLFSEKAREYINDHYPEIQVIIQNATFMGTVDDSRYTVAFLQDNLRAMGRVSEEQEQNLLSARKRVTNSIATALSYPEHDFEVIPVGVDSELFKPMNKNEVRKELGFKNGTIGIFVGNFSEVKGWSEVRECIRQFPEITWILVTKYDETFNAPNVRVFSRIPQKLLAKMLNCADFFIIGSPQETQCLAAVEACLCNVPVIMRKVGIFREFGEELSKIGIFGEDFVAAIQELPHRTFSPRQTILDKKLTAHDSMQKWKRLLTSIFQELAIEKVKRQTSKKVGVVNKGLVSIVIPTRNRPEYLKDAIESALAQTYPYKEVIVIDDGSEDDRTENLCKKYPVRYFKKERGSTASSLNLGIKNMKGEWFKWLSDDDFLEPTALKDLLNVDKPIVYGEYYKVTPEKAIIARFRETDFPDWLSFACALYDHLIGNRSTILIRKDCFDTVGLFNESLSMHEDYDWWLRACIGKKIMFTVIHDVVVNCRAVPAQSTFGRMGLIRRNLLDSLEPSYRKWFDKEQKRYNKKPFKKKVKLVLKNGISHLPLTWQAKISSLWRRLH